MNISVPLICLALTTFLNQFSNAQTFCDNGGNLVIYSNYEGGILNIDIDENIPNLKIGIVSYESCLVVISGAFAGNVTEVIYAGFDIGSACSGLAGSEIIGVPPGIVTQYSSTNLAISPFLEVPIAPGFPPISNCITSNSFCDAEDTPMVVQFFLSEFGAGTSLRSHFTLNNCWNNLNVAISDGGNCCLQTPLGDPNPIYQGGSNYDFIVADTVDLCDGPVTFDLSFYPALVSPPLYTGYVWSDGTTGPVITIDTPGTYSMSLADACFTGFNGLLEDQIVVLPCADPLVVSIPDLTLCAGEISSIEAAVSGGIPPYLYQWSPNIGSGSGPISFSAPANSFTINLVVTDANGTTTSATSDITIVQENISVDLGPDQEICNPPLVLDASNTDALSYAWSTGETAPTISVSNAGTYSVTVNGTCSTATDEIEITPCVDALTVALGDQTICLGETAFLEATVAGGLPPYTFAWTPDISNTAGPIGVSPISATVYSVVVTDGQGTQATATATVNVITESLNVNLGPDQEICNPPLVLDASNTDALSYAWSTGETAPTISVSNAGTYSVTVNGTCGTATDEIEITPCVDALTVALGDQTICLGETAFLEATAAGGLAPYTFAWTPDISNTAGPIGVSPISATVYSVVVTDGQGTQATATGTVNVITESLNVNLGPDQEICNPPLVLDASNTDALSYAWSTGETAPTIAVSTPGAYSVEVMGQCGIFEASILVEDCDPLSATLTNGAICLGDSIDLSLQVSGGEPPYLYEWASTDLEGPGPFTVSPEFSQTYSVEITDSEGTQLIVPTFIQVLPLIEELGIPDRLFFCDGDTILVDASVLSGLTYSWSTGLQTPQIELSAPEEYTVTVQTECSLITETLMLVEKTYPIEKISLLRINQCEENGAANIGIIPTEGVSVDWNDGIRDFSRNVETSGTYVLRYQTPCSSDSLNFTVNFTDCDCEIFIPNAFTPDGDGLNDLFKPIINCDIISYSFKVFNRWGEPVFSTSKMDRGWNGSQGGTNYYVQSELFQWQLILQKNNTAGEIIEKKGQVTLIR